MLNYRYDLQKLIDALEEAGELDIFIGDIFRFNLVCAENYGVKEVLFDEHVAQASKRDYFNRVFAPVLSGTLRKFILQLIDNNDLHFYEPISRKLLDLIGREKNSNFMEVISAAALSSGQQELIKAELERILQGRVYLHNTISPKILGGLIIKSGEKMLDFSVRSSLDKLKTVLAH
ncbi:MAG: ATP synthase F1 subunit delta [Candidatus Margulisbacteria bacterium]|jgi:F-type H+-transporting ATPase subunit delta|nr:ATP synthase F1 subunit delta [Candidatus Margulisiibacteriota bacterium]